MTATYAPAAPSPVVRVLRQLVRDSRYVLLGFPLGLLAVVLTMVGFFLGIGLTVIWIGLPVLMVTLLLARGLATVERFRIRSVLGRDVPQPRYKQVIGPRFWRRIFRPLSDPQCWFDLLHGMFRFIPSTIAFSFVVTWWAGAIGGLTFPLWDWSIYRGPDNTDLPELIGLGDAAATRIIFYLAVGAFFAATLYPVVRGVALIEAGFARALLSTIAELRQQVAEAQDERDTARAQKVAAVSAEATALRRLERDIHDGPQQRLVRLAMDLGRAEQQFTTDPEAARATVAEALTQTRETLDELRALSRGIAPPILVDRGLRAALTALAGRSTVPVDLDAPELDRMEPTVESTAYFVVAEALTNVAKHSHATEVQVSLQRSIDGLMITVTDDGVGGASPAKGHGLAGLMDRVHAAGGVLSVVSPEGAGTTLTVALPV
ncbi:sensor histidine kinase [Jidongwangia harbinensis]|uniref:sensor histidine kinase n=1 Tax=Jidongwangia harbinensis TaxID=2878561 RepID=UPI001CD9EA27|nr:sensor histidine kinase [Jidongwangia harbinensis]MCA2214432.1 sensor histidine kinase [Jidongwangia harbinensis]